MLTISFTSDPTLQTGSTRDQLGEALQAIGFIRERDAVVQGLGRELAPEASEVSEDGQTAEEPKAAEPVKRGRGRPPKAAEPAPAAPEKQPEPEAPRQISAEPEDRKEPEPKAAEPAPEPKKLTHDDVRGALYKYVTKYGMAAAQQDGQAFTGFPKVSEIPDDQAALSKAVRSIEEALTANPFDRAVVG